MDYFCLFLVTSRFLPSGHPNGYHQYDVHGSPYFMCDFGCKFGKNCFWNLLQTEPSVQTNVFVIGRTRHVHLKNNNWTTKLNRDWKIHCFNNTWLGRSTGPQTDLKETTFWNKLNLETEQKNSRETRWQTDRTRSSLKHSWWTFMDTDRHEEHFVIPKQYGGSGQNDIRLPESHIQKTDHTSDNFRRHSQQFLYTYIHNIKNNFWSNKLVDYRFSTVFIIFTQVVALEHQWTFLMF